MAEIVNLKKNSNNGFLGGGKPGWGAGKLGRFGGKSCGSGAEPGFLEVHNYTFSGNWTPNFLMYKH